MEVVCALLAITVSKAQGIQLLALLAHILAVTEIQTLLIVQLVIQECIAKVQP